MLKLNFITSIANNPGIKDNTKIICKKYYQGIILPVIKIKMINVNCRRTKKKDFTEPNFNTNLPRYQDYHLKQELPHRHLFLEWLSLVFRTPSG